MDAPSTQELAQQRTAMASMRTLMAADRTLMAWVRTGLSLQSFGFTIYKVLEGFQEAGRLLHDQTPRVIGLLLTAMGTLVMVMGLVEYLYTHKELGQPRRAPLVRPSFVMAALMSMLGGALFFGIFARVL